MPHRVCPWWLGYLLVSPLRRWRQNPRTILAPLVRPGMTVLEPGSGMGFFTIELARLVGPDGKVVAIDVQQKMLDGLRRRARRAGLEVRIDARMVGAESLGVDDLAGAVDFVLAFAMVHEVPDAGRFFAEAHRSLKPGGAMLVAEPVRHVSEEDFAATLALAEKAGLRVEGRPEIASSRAAVLRR
jgi:ubiquinone/menaquinone biosynthesis C-methylase UbiE